jgi:hypothetical protein
VLTKNKMLTTRVKILLGCFLGSITLVLGLYEVSDLLRLRPGGFYRKLPSHSIVGVSFIKLDGKYVYIAGGNDSVVYIASRRIRSKLLRLKLNTKDTTAIKIHGLDTVKYTQAGYLRTNDSSLYIFDGNRPVIVSGNVKNGELLKRFTSVRFTTSVPLSRTSYILRIAKNGRQNVLVKVDNEHTSNSIPLGTENGNTFLTDGVLLCAGDRILYVDYYRNKWLCLDTNLKVKYHARTIDTVAHAHITIGKKSVHETTLSSPPLFVNEQCTANRKYLFVHSALKADNELSDAMTEVAIIDVYNLKDGNYKQSFYIGNFNGEKMRDFKVYGRYLVALFDHYLYTYELKF